MIAGLEEVIFAFSDSSGKYSTEVISYRERCLGLRTIRAVCLSAEFVMISMSRWLL